EEDCGMLFVYTDDAVRTFWMKNTYIPLDIIWLDSGKEVVYIARNVQPCGVGDCPSIDPGVAARYVLEVDAGEAQKMNLQVGNEFSLVF
ncbi:DUF192 domain-containing protein, partial [Patescibacteria group bacterium]|nr:DUF192 domain-containing protein [Patescibacteria group bacterium]